MTHAGYKNPTHQELKLANLVLCVSLRKEWSNNPSYWVEIYVVVGGKTKKGNKIPDKFFVYRQWSFYKSSTKESIEGNFLEDVYFNFDMAIQRAVHHVAKRLKKEDIIHKITPDEPSLSLIIDFNRRLNQLTRKPIPQNSPITMSAKESSAFKRSQQTREKNSKW